ncbi:MAG: hypothetical protein ASARMPRED_006098 [Alectoria sarmentosa]|nr:MAG: hypothetical protein ASARMPRED_006098 [Alectoria sarmentosa]
MLNDDRCFLEHDVWQNLFRSVVLEPGTALSDSSGVVVSLWTIICPIPSLFKDVQNAVCNFTITRTIGSLYARAREIWTLVLQWRGQFEELSLSRNSPEHSGDDKRYKTLGIYMANLIVVNRLSVSLDTRAGSDLEDERQYSASRIVELDRRARAVNPRASFFMKFKLIMAQATLGTKGEWQQVIRLSSEYARVNSLISSQVLEHWVNLKGRKTTSLSAATIQRIQSHSSTRESQ